MCKKYRHETSCFSFLFQNSVGFFFNDAFSTASIKLNSVKREGESEWWIGKNVKRMVVAYFKVRSLHSLSCTEGNPQNKWIISAGLRPGFEPDITRMGAKLWSRMHKTRASICMTMAQPAVRQSGARGPVLKIKICWKTVLYNAASNCASCL